MISVVTVRDAKHTNFVEFRNFKIVYRRYAGLYFCICVDVNDNNLYYLEAIHNFVEVLNEYFHNVCELDLVFNFYKVYTVVDEMVIMMIMIFNKFLKLISFIPVPGGGDQRDESDQSIETVDNVQLPRIDLLSPLLSLISRL